MIVFVSKSRDAIWIKARAESKGIIGDLTEIVRPGSSFLGHPYEWWAALEDGEHEVA